MLVPSSIKQMVCLIQTDPVTEIMSIKPLAWHLCDRASEKCWVEKMLLDIAVLALDSYMSYLLQSEEGQELQSKQNLRGTGALRPHPLPITGSLYMFLYSFVRCQGDRRYLPGTFLSLHVIGNIKYRGILQSHPLCHVKPNHKIK